MLYDKLITDLTKDFLASDYAKTHKLNSMSFSKKAVELLMSMFTDTVLSLEKGDELRLYNGKGKYVGRFKKALRKGRTYHVAKKGGGYHDIDVPDTVYLTFKQFKKFGK